MSTAESSNTVMATVFSERRSDLTITARETRADGVVALGLVAYGLFSLAQARYRRLGTA